MPEDPLKDFHADFPSPGKQGAIAVFEMFQNFVEAGFTEQQALLIVAFVIKPAGM